MSNFDALIQDLVIPKTLGRTGYDGGAMTPDVDRRTTVSSSHLTPRWREPDSNHRSRGIGGRLEGNTGIYGRMAHGAARTQALPTICHGILSLQEP
jgi:hypothetical protein